MAAHPAVLAAMPWQSLDCPSLPIALLNASAVAAGFAPAEAYHGNLHWAEFLLAATGGEIGPPEYTEIADNGLFDSLGDWAFTGVLHDDDQFGVAALHEYARDRGVDITAAGRMREHARDFVDAAAARILATGPAVVGFTSTFMQNVPSLATAKRIKELDPGVRVVFGGGNCDGVMGTALHRSFPFVDFVVRGEGEVAWPALLAAFAGDRDYAAVPGLCWRDRTGSTCVNDQAPPLPAGRIPAPDYTGWFEQLAASPVSEYVEPKLVLESARGCWWGEKHHCTFCGLNGTLMEFRAKPAERVLDEITSMVLRHQVLDVVMVDNIISEHAFGDLLPRLAELGWDLRIHYEVKSNLRPSDIALLRASGVIHVQPGIESLVTPALRLMDKGVTGVRNLRTLRDCESAGLTVSWNWLYGFPGERLADYEPVISQLPALVHLQPPAGISRILLERFSPNFDNPALGFTRRAAARAYQHVYALPAADLDELVYLFDSDPQGLTSEEAGPLRDRLHDWIGAYTSSSLRCTDTGDELLIEDRRAGWPERDHHITSPWLRAAYAELEHGRTLPALRRGLAERHGAGLAEDELHGWLATLAADGLVFHEHGSWLALATRTEPLKVDS